MPDLNSLDIVFDHDHDRRTDNYDSNKNPDSENLQSTIFTRLFNMGVPRFDLGGSSDKGNSLIHGALL